MAEIPNNISSTDLVKAMERIDAEGVPPNAHSSTYDVVYNGKPYPPKLVVAWANAFANGKELDRNSFNGGQGTECFKLLERQGFQVQPKKHASYWFVGASFDGGANDRTDEFCETGTWENGYTDKYLDDVNRIKVGDRIAIKSTYTKKKNLPFEANGNTASVMAIKATGVVTENEGDGRHLKVDWTKLPNKKEWFFYTQRETIWEVKPGDPLTDALIKFTFDDQPQDFNLFLNHKFWSDRFGDHSEAIDYLPELEKFLDQAKTGELATKGYRKQVYGLQVKVSFGQGYPARVPWISFLEKGQKTSQGIYPGYLYFKDVEVLFLTYGSSEENPPPVTWQNVDGPSCREYLSEHFSYEPPRYGQTKIFKAYDLKDGLDREQVNEDLFELVQLYKNVLSEESMTQEASSLGTSERNVLNPTPLNSVLYGPPGTGKTYNTINMALSIIDPDFLAANENNRASLKERFDQLMQDDRIHFVTFHQSFSYEDFVEGIKASTSDGGIRYDVASGVFKKACQACMMETGTSDIDSLLSQLIEEVAEKPKTLKTPTGKEFSVSYRGDNTTFTCTPHSSEEKRGLPASIEHVRQVALGAKPENVYCKSYVNGIAQYLTNFQDRIAPQRKFDSEPVVLIIDEINRGNISSIFGELITLIEPSKRAGAEESIVVTLPYSKEPFEVPGNLYIIGTMNTADRSLALMDTALRRRFDFIEMMPDINLLDGLYVHDIDIAKMLKVMNQRIEVFYDREHTLGHAFFMSLFEEKTEHAKFARLREIFSTKIIPLLEEYFFEDWQKIRLVLNDHNKKNEFQFVREQTDEYDLEKLFGTNAELPLDIEESSVFSRNDSALSFSESYVGIYES